MSQPVQTLHESTRTRVVRAVRDGRSVVLKQLRSAWPTPESLGRLQREHDLLKAVEGSGAPRAIEVQLDPPQLVTEDIGGVAVDAWLSGRPASREAALTVAIGLARAVDAVHRRGVLHRDINPANVVVVPSTLEVQLIDFDLASPVALLGAKAQSAGPLEGTPAYLAPEQTGRTNRAVDARSDLYGLGATLYALYAGRPPFHCDDVLGYVHAHLAEMPPPLEGAPPFVRQLIATLLRKRPEDRYQSAAGVVLDLERFRAGETVPIGMGICDRPTLPQDLVGRETELQALEEAFERARGGGRAIALVHGEAGIGKTSLVRELVPSLTLAGGRLLEGKFDQYTRDVPYTALGQVLTAFVAEALSEATDGLDRWRTRLVEATAPNTGLLVDLAPQLEVLLGAQKPVATLAPTEAQSRLQETVRRAIRAIAAPNRPLVLFLDDLQWADLPSLKVLEALFRDPALRHVLLIAAWRDTEVGEAHALQPTLASLEATGAEVVRLGLGPLQPCDVERLVRLALHQDEVGTLGARLHEKTRGNPFFLRRLVEEAGQTVLRFDRGALRWRWDDASIDALALADNVVGLLQDELRRLSGDVRACVSAAALLGDPFDLAGLVTATGLDPDVLASAVDAAIHARFLRALDSDYWFGGHAMGRFRFAFVHDRVQQAARELLSDDDRAHMHLAIARGLVVQPDAPAFRTADHYGAALELVDDPVELLQVVKTLAAAADRALSCAAFEPAHRFAEAALDARAEHRLELEPHLLARLRRQAARAAWLVGDIHQMQIHLDALREGASLRDRLRAETIRVHAMIAHGDPSGALDLALVVLAEAGVELPRKPGPDQVQAAVLAVLPAASEADVDGLPEMPFDPLEVARRRLLVRIASAAYVAEPNLLPLIACALVRRTLAEGTSKESSYGFGLYALCLCAAWALEPGAQQGDNALRLLARFPDRVHEGGVRHLVHHFVRVWSEPLRRIFQESSTVYRQLMDVGDLEYAGWVSHMRVVYGFFSGVPLAELATEIDHAVAVMRLHDMAAALHCTLQFAQLVDGLRGRAADPARLVGPGYDEGAAMQAHQAIDFRAAVLALSVCQLTARLYAGAPDAVEAAETALAYADGAVALFYQVPLRVYGAIARMDAGHEPASILEMREPVEACAAHNPDGAHLLCLLDAEIARRKGDLSGAIACYDASIRRAGQANFLHDQAFACERAAAMHLDRGNERIARAYLRDARHAWLRWGATACVERLDAAFPGLVAPEVPDESDTLKSRRAMPSSELDLMSLLKASQAISEETELDALLSRALWILVENVGATRGVLLLARRGELRLEAELRHGSEVELHGGAEPDGVPLPTVRRVFRTGTAEVRDIDGVATLCAPVTHQGRHLGVLWFENDLTAGAFSPARVRILEVLAPQLAISVRNVRLQQAQSRFVPRQFLRSLDRSDIIEVDVGDHALKEVTVFFSDIWGFTPLVERLSAKDALGFINRYLSYAEPAITGNGGFIDTYLGDGIMALFDGGSNASDAVSASIAFHHALDRFNDERRRASMAHVRTGVGLNTGTVTMGTIGGQRSIKCGVVGDSVNLASRVEGLTRRTQTRLLISGDTLVRLRPGFHTRRAGRVVVKGRDRPLDVHEVLDAETPSVRQARLATLTSYEAALDAYFAGEPSQAAAELQRVLDHSPDDAQARRFLEMANALLRDGLPEGWDGIERLTVKRQEPRP